MIEAVREAVYKWKLKKKLDCLYTDIYIDNYDDEFHHIDYFMVRGTRLVIVKYFDYIGNIYGSENITEWTQTIGHGGFKFKNPLRDLRDLSNLIQDKLPEFEILYYAMFSDKCSFPKPMPETVIKRSELFHELKHTSNGGGSSDCEALKTQLEMIVKG